ncbi:MAG: insulinase family protein [Ignavibacteriaceae bacterium]|nr:insulinase family protein [Ignavibacteriaceae bacterium]
MKILNIEYEKYNLSNGLQVILHQNKNLPLAAINIWYKVGSAFETRGKTGLAHLFEHMMFQGSENAAKEMHFRLIQEAGGTLNGSTTFDRTNYYEKVPSNFLELALWLESDRMGFLLPALTLEKLDNQKGVVSNERLERYENQPYGLAWEKILAALFKKEFPYSWPTIGYLEDIQSYTLEDVSTFFKNYYSPHNACLVIAGDFDTDHCKKLVEKYFESIQSNSFIRNDNIEKPSLEKTIYLQYEDNVQLERIYLAWHSDKAYSNDDAALDTLADILSGSKNSRLYKKLVFEKEIAQDVSAMQISGKLTGIFMIVATAKPGKDISEIKQDIFDEIQHLETHGVIERELLKSKNGIKASFINSLQQIDNLADHLNSYNYFLGEPNSFISDLNRYESINSTSLKMVASKYLTQNYVELIVKPLKKVC